MELSVKKKMEMLKVLGGGKFIKAKTNQHKISHARKVSSIKEGLEGSKNLSKKNSYYSCKKKSRYATQGEATWYANRAMSNRKCKLRVYHCIYCDGWHITSTSLRTQDEKSC